MGIKITRRLELTFGFFLLFLFHRREASQVSGVWESVQSEFQSDNAQPKTHGL